MTSTTSTRDCATCGRPIAVTARNPNRRYCTGRCRVADWHRRNRTDPANAVPNAVHAIANGVPAIANGVPTANGVPRPDTGAPGNGNPTRCPHCQAPITVLTWLLPPTAAHVTIPDRHD